MSLHPTVDLTYNLDRNILDKPQKFGTPQHLLI